MPTMNSASTAPPISFSRRRELSRNSAISFLMQQAVENPGVISLAAGLVDYETLPLEELALAVESVLSHPAEGKQALQYGTTAGNLPLRRLLREHLARLEATDVESLGIDLDQIILTTGSQQLLSLVCEVLFDPGDICLVAGPTYFVFAGNLEGVGARPVTVAADGEGMRPDALDAALAEIGREGQLHLVKLIYVVSYYDNPGGVSISTDRREEIVRIARKWSREQRILILEDAAYRELRYDGPVFPSVWSFDAEREQVIYAQTFSKSFSPGLRVGYGVLPRELVQPLHDRKGNEDFGSANFNQHLLATVLKSGRAAEHLENVLAGYRIKRDAMVAAAQRYFSDIPGVTWHEPHGGLYVWMSLPREIETGFDSRLFKTAVEQGVMYVPGELCYAMSLSERPRHQMRLSFGVQTPAGIEAGMQRLAAAVRMCLSET